MKNTLFTCTVCTDIFRSRSDLNNHVRRHHQSVIKIKFQNDNMTEVKKRVNGGFECTCGKRFKLSWPLQRHAKRCNDELTVSEENEEKTMSNNSDASEFMNVNERTIPIDCFDALILMKSADCRE